MLISLFDPKVDASDRRHIEERIIREEFRPSDEAHHRFLVLKNRLVTRNEKKSSADVDFYRTQDGLVSFWIPRSGGMVVESSPAPGGRQLAFRVAESIGSSDGDAGGRRLSVEMLGKTRLFSSRSSAPIILEFDYSPGFRSNSQLFDSPSRLTLFICPDLERSVLEAYGGNMGVTVDSVSRKPVPMPLVVRMRSSEDRSEGIAGSAIELPQPLQEAVDLIRNIPPSKDYFKRRRLVLAQEGLAYIPLLNGWDIPFWVIVRSESEANSAIRLGALPSRIVAPVMDEGGALFYHRIHPEIIALRIFPGESPLNAVVHWLTPLFSGPPLLLKTWTDRSRALPWTQIGFPPERVEQGMTVLREAENYLRSMQ